jgi:hypothetical protein
MKVLGAGVVSGSGFYGGGATVDVFFANVAADYAQPTSNRIGQQAVNIWLSMHSALPQEPSASILSGGQVWTKYGLILQTRIGDLTTLLAHLRTADTQSARDQAFTVFNRSVRFRVYDFERRQFVDEKDFVGKNFRDG